MRHFSTRQWVTLIALALVLLFTGFQAVRTAQRVGYWQRHRDEPIRPWMTLGYVARSYRVPPHVLYQAVGLPLSPRDRRPLSHIARSQKRPVQELIQDLKLAIIRTRPPFLPPSPPPPDGRTP